MNRLSHRVECTILLYGFVVSKLKSYILAGHCFDYTKLIDNNSAFGGIERWSSAVQGGAGVHWNLTEKLDLSFVVQYMLHLGNKINAERVNGYLTFTKEKGASLEGHMLLHVGINYKLGQLW